jgi:RNA recognition motif-containing protein
MNHTRVFVGDLSPNFTEEQLRGVLSEMGKVHELVINDPTPLRLQRFAIVEMSDPDAAKQAVKRLNGQVVDGYRLFVYTLPPKTKPRERS